MNVVFDLGNVLIQWDPRRLYRRLFAGDEARVDWFLTHVCNQEWNERQDAGRLFAEGIAEKVAAHPQHKESIEAYHHSWEEMMGDEVPGVVEVLRELKVTGVPLYALSNFSCETFPFARRRFPFLQWFRGIVLSGEERLIKPDPRIYQLLLARYGLKAEDTVFIDDSQKNVDAAEALGITGIHFSGAELLRARLQELRLLA